MKTFKKIVLKYSNGAPSPQDQDWYVCYDGENEEYGVSGDPTSNNVLSIDLPPNADDFMIRGFLNNFYFFGQGLRAIEEKMNLQLKPVVLSINIEEVVFPD